VYFWHGVITNLLNPKAAVFYIAVLPGFIIAGDAVMTQTALLTTIYVGVATLVHCLVVLLGSHYHPVMQHPRNEKIARVFFTLALIAVALWFAVSTGA
jgi:threonine/homoserine/homoserine lactone efflux protein